MFASTIWSTLLCCFKNKIGICLATVLVIIFIDIVPSHLTSALNLSNMSSWHVFKLLGSTQWGDFGHSPVNTLTLWSVYNPKTTDQVVGGGLEDTQTTELQLLSTCCLNRRTGQVSRFQEQVDCWLCKNCLRLPVLTVLSGYLWVKLGSLECTWMFSQQAPDQCWIICLFNVIFVILYNTLDFIRKLKNYSHLFTGLAV